MEFLGQVVGFANLVLLAFVPYVLASQGTMLAGRTGVFVVAQEGIMLVGASVGFLAALYAGSLLVGVLAAALAGGLFGVVLACAISTLKMDQFVTGLALFFLGLGMSSLLFKLAVGVTLVLPRIPTLSAVKIPLLGDIPIIGPIFFEQNLLVYFSVLISVVLYYYLYRTSWGLDLRAVGENPKSADSLGISVARMQYGATILGCMLMGIAGAYLPMVYTGAFTQGIVQGRGWLAIALTFFGGWQPRLIFAGAFFFALVEVLSVRAQVVGGAIPHQFLRMLPYIATILVMIYAFRWVRVPAFLGQNYDREKRSLS